ncbi:glutamate-cysteine ligase family protein [Tomitella biformata]|uniref:glutamate-cysteine ligase family protein n=1 Tax=Tomitella biformata TaxID=630403 RepID=UPI0004664515|nr:glutamate-cysteine ligase family protein [Tomitella biformata]
MGEDVAPRRFTRKDRSLFRERGNRCLEALAQMLAQDDFDVAEPRIGIEVELNLVDSAAEPAMANTQVLDAVNDDTFQTELGQFNIEINMPPHPLRGRHLLEFEESLRGVLNSANEHARRSGRELAMIGILPTLREEHLTRKAISDDPRYGLLNEQMLRARGEDIELHITGIPLSRWGAPEQLDASFGTIAPEAACTSLQLHLQVAPDQFAAHWNAAQAISAVQVAVGANSPFLFGRALWHETRLPLFEQSTDIRPPELVNQGVRPRVWFGERWITSVFDLFEENSRYFTALLPVCSDEDPLAVLAAGGTPLLSELQMHNGTIYRWNRPVYDITDGGHHLRLENRVLPAGPSVADTLADAAFFYGLVRGLVDADRPLWSQMAFGMAGENLAAAARGGFDARLHWPAVGSVEPRDLVLRLLLPIAHAGLASYGIDSAVRERYLGIIEQRCTAERNGARWQRDAVRAREDAGASRSEALTGMLRDYLTLMGEGDPVHTWPI